jgi:hypothetical protein
MYEIAGIVALFGVAAMWCTIMETLYDIRGSLYDLRRRLEVLEN